jgi:hypothetical protein
MPLVLLNGVIQKEAINLSDGSFAACQAENILIVLFTPQTGVNFYPPTFCALSSI